MPRCRGVPAQTIRARFGHRHNARASHPASHPCRRASTRRVHEPSPTHGFPRPASLRQEPSPRQMSRQALLGQSPHHGKTCSTARRQCRPKRKTRRQAARQRPRAQAPPARQAMRPAAFHSTESSLRTQDGKAEAVRFLLTQQAQASRECTRALPPLARNRRRQDEPS